MHVCMYVCCSPRRRRRRSRRRQIETAAAVKRSADDGGGGSGDTVLEAHALRVLLLRAGGSFKQKTAKLQTTYRPKSRERSSVGR